MIRGRVTLQVPSSGGIATKKYTIKIPSKFVYVAIHFLAIPSLQSFVHATAAQLSYHVKILWRSLC